MVPVEQMKRIAKAFLANWFDWFAEVEVAIGMIRETKAPQRETKKPFRETAKANVDAVASDGNGAAETVGPESDCNPVGAPARSPKRSKKQNDEQPRLFA
jgi:hypothetical protein